MKICKCCSLEKDITEYTNNKRNKDGKETICKACGKEKRKNTREKQLESQRKWRAKNPDYMKEYQQSEKRQEYQKKYYEANSQGYKDRKKEWRKENPQREKEARDKYREENKEKLNEYYREWKAKKRLDDMQYKLKENISRRIRYELNTLLKGKKSKRTTEYIGCSIEELKEYIEKQFTEGITWDNYGSVWHIDHIIPCASWNLEDEFENKCCWNFRNLRPLFASENQSKNDKYDSKEKEEYIQKIKLITATTA